VVAVDVVLCGCPGHGPVSGKPVTETVVAKEARKRLPVEENS